MPENSAPIEIPKRALFKAGEVCDLAKVQPYVLRTWEAEFPDLGVAKAAGGPRVYRREDVEQVLRIKHLLLVEGLTLAGARRRLEEDAGPVAAAGQADMEELLGRNARERITAVRRGLRGLLDLLSARGEAFTLSAPSVERGTRLVTPSRKPAAKARPTARRAARGRRR